VVAVVLVLIVVETDMVEQVEVRLAVRLVAIV
jgi:hypothetical protein